MADFINRQRLRDLVAQGAQLVDVLPADEYKAQHLPGALSIPLRQLDARAPGELDPQTAAVVYCWDSG